MNQLWRKRMPCLVTEIVGHQIQKWGQHNASRERSDTHGN
ncbi:Uncharacterised protein [Vibrio cholerae]|nr:Uncharacterised protein [Vibrio cholerae]